MIFKKKENGAGLKLKVCFAMFRAYPLFDKSVDETVGGSEVELFKLAVYLAGFDDIRVDFIVGDYGQGDIEIINNVRLIKVRYMRLDKYRRPIHKLLRYVNLFRVLLRERSDICFTKTASELLGWMTLIMKFLKGGKVIFRLGSDKDADPGFWKNSGKLYPLYKFGLRHCDRIYTQSINQKRALEMNSGLKSRVLKNVFSMAGGKPAANKEYVLWVSRCEPLKRPLLFIELARRVPNEKFIIIMPHARKANSLQDGLINRIISEVGRAADELNNLEYIESVPFDQIQSYYDRAKLFVNTSEYEGFPNSFIQSGLGRTGILSFRVNPDGFLDEYGAGICCDDDLGKAAAFIEGLNPERIRTLGDRAHSYVAMNHDIREIGMQYIRDFIELAGSKLEIEGVC